MFDSFLAPQPPCGVLRAARRTLQLILPTSPQTITHPPTDCRDHRNHTHQKYSARATADAAHEASGRGPAAKCSQDSPGEPRCTRCAADLKLKARRHCRPRRRKQSRNPLRIVGTIAITKIQKYSVRSAAHSRRNRFQKISGPAACADAPCVTRSSPEGADFMAGRVHAVALARLVHALGATHTLETRG